MGCRELPEHRSPVIYQVQYRGAPARDYGEKVTKSRISLILQTNQNLLSPYIKEARAFFSHRAPNLTTDTARASKHALPYRAAA